MLRLLDLTLPTPEENLALDEALLLGLERASASDGSNVEETLRFWESPVPFVVVGSSGRLREEVDLEACRTARVPVLRRASAGGSVLQAPGCLNFALVLSLDARPQLRDVGESYRTIIGRLAGALALDDAEFRGTSDLALAGRKVSGNAQKRMRRALLHHGTVLHGLDGALLSRFLLYPRNAPLYRASRTHQEFVRNVPLPPAEIKTRVAGAWAASPPAPRFDASEVRRLTREKYGSREWLERF